MKPNPKRYGEKYDDFFFFIRVLWDETLKTIVYLLKRVLSKAVAKTS